MCATWTEAFRTMKMTTTTDVFLRCISKAKKQLKKYIKNGLLELHSKQEDLWALRPVYYINFPLKEFRDKINQTLRTDKYMYTLKVKGKQHKSS
jgi:PHP family Zn ribbon phosphoesterase